MIRTTEEAVVQRFFRKRRIEEENAIKYSTAVHNYWKRAFQRCWRETAWGENYDASY